MSWTIWASRLSTIFQTLAELRALVLLDFRDIAEFFQSANTRVGSRWPSPQPALSQERVGRCPQQLEELPLSSSCCCSAASVHLSVPNACTPVAIGQRTHIVPVRKEREDHNGTKIPLSSSLFLSRDTVRTRDTRGKRRKRWSTEDAHTTSASYVGAVLPVSITFTFAPSFPERLSQTHLLIVCSRGV